MRFILEIRFEHPKVINGFQSKVQWKFVAILKNWWNAITANNCFCSLKQTLNESAMNSNAPEDFLSRLKKKTEIKTEKNKTEDRRPKVWIHPSSLVMRTRKLKINLDPLLMLPHNWITTRDKRRIKAERIAGFPPFSYVSISSFLAQFNDHHPFEIYTFVSRNLLR